MNIGVESFWYLWFQNNELIIQWTTLTLILILALWIVLPYLHNNEPQAEDIEKAIRKITKETRFPLNQTLGSTKSPAANSSTEFKQLKKELQFKNTQIAKLKKEAHSKVSDKTNELAKIKKLEKKLAEYEIIENEIANLSRYKEENKKLKAKLINKN